MKYALFERFFGQKIRNLLDVIINYKNHNIYQEQRRRALLSTVDLIEKDFGSSFHKCFNNRNDLISAIIDQVSVQDGYWFEFGVFQGVSINFIARLIYPKTIYGFDSFKGLPEHWRYNFGKKVFAVSKLPKVSKNVKLVTGWFNDSLPKFLKKNKVKRCSFIHIDSDLYSSAKTILSQLEYCIGVGTIILFDEYFNFPDWQNGEYKAFQEFIKKHKAKFEYLGYCRADEQVAVKILEIKGRKGK